MKIVVPAARWTPEEGLAMYRTSLERRGENAAATVAKWAAKIPEGPLYALEWAASAYDNAALLEMIRICTKLTAPEQTCDTVAILRNVRDYVRGQVMWGARSGRSSSGCANLAKDALTAAFARELEDLDRLVSRAEEVAAQATKAVG